MKIAITVTFDNLMQLDVVADALEAQIEIEQASLLEDRKHGVGGPVTLRDKRITAAQAVLAELRGARFGSTK